MTSAPPPQPTKEAPRGSDDPLMWCARRVRRHALWGSLVIAVLILLFEGGMYTLFTTAIYEGDIEGESGLILLLLVPFILAVVAAIAAGVLARNVGRLARQPGAPEAAPRARLVLWLSVLVWALLFMVFPLSLLVTTEPDDPGNDPFPIGIVTVLPVYMGLCVALYTTGAALVTYSDRNKVEASLVMLLGWAGLAMFIVLPAVVSSWDIGSGNVNWDEAIWWLRFGHFFPTIVPFLVFVGLLYVHDRNIEIIEQDSGAGLPPPVGKVDRRPDACPRCGGTMSVHPRTQEVFCPACGEGLATEPQDVVVETPMDLFVEQASGPETEPDLKPEPAPMAHATGAATTVAAASPEPAPAQEPSAPRFCSQCGSELSTLSKTGQVFCTGCGAGLPAAAPRVQVPVQSSEPSSAPTPPSPGDAPPAPAIPSHPAQPRPSKPGPGGGKCRVCGGMMTTHPRTQELFCPACGAGLPPQI